MSNKNLFEFIEETLENKKEKVVDEQLVSKSFFEEALSENPVSENNETTIILENTFPNESKDVVEKIEIEKELENKPVFSKLTENNKKELPEIATILSKEDNKDTTVEKEEVRSINNNSNNLSQHKNEENIPEIASMIVNSGNEVVVTKSETLEDLKANQISHKKYKRPSLSEIMNIKRAIPQKHYNIKTANVILILATLIFLSISF